MRIGIVTALLIAVTVLLTAAMLVTAGWERPPMDSTQMGYRGTAIVDIQNPRLLEEKIAAIEVPPPPYEFDPAEAEDGPTAGELYENVTVLKDISAEEFNYLMAAITEWVSPEQGCAYCHNEENLASDEVYTKNVARRMIQMNQSINVNWSDHVTQTGVTCYTCHRGMPVPAYVWDQDDSSKPSVGLMGYRPEGQNIANARAAFSSMTSDPVSAYVRGAQDVRVATMTNQGLDDGHGASLKKTERTYSLMLHMSNALGVNCTYCHNTRSFAKWDQSSPQRSQAWWGLQMLAKINQDYVLPLVSALPKNRLDPHGAVPTVSCQTCHQGLAKPLNGAEMAKDYPSLNEETSK